MASVTPQALDLLGTIPSAQDLMLQASQQDAKSIENKENAK